MAVSGKTAAPHEIPYFLGTDKPPDMAAGTKAIADRVHSRLGEISPGQIVGGSAGKLVISGSTGAGAYQAMKGDATLAEDGTLQLGAGVVGTNELAANAATTAKLDDKAVTLAKLAEALGLTEGYLADGAVGSRKLRPTSGEKLLSENVHPGGEAIEFPGCKLEITPSVASILYVDAVAFLELAAPAGTLHGSMHAYLTVDGVAQLKVMKLTAFTANSGGAVGLTIPQVYRIPLSAGLHTIRMFGIADELWTGTITGVWSGHTGYRYTLAAA